MKKISIVIIIIIVSCMIYLTYFKNNRNKQNKTNEYYLIEYSHQQDYTYDVNYKELYYNNIINKNNNNIYYSVITDSNSIYGNLYIENNNLYVNNDMSKEVVKILKEINFKSLYKIEEENIDNLECLALSDTGDLYIISLDSLDIKDVKYTKIELKSKVLNFTNLKLESYLLGDNKSIIVYCEDGNMYDVFSKVLYSPNILNINNQYIVYEDNKISDYNGNMLLDLELKPYIIKSIIISKKNVYINDYIDTNIILITNDNKLISLYDKVYYSEFNNKIKSIKENNNIITIKFENNEKIEFIGFYDEKYSI